MWVLQNTASSEIKDMATSTDNIEPENRLANGRANGAGKPPSKSKRENDNGTREDQREVAVSAAGDDIGMALAEGQSGVTWNTEHTIAMRMFLAQREVKTLEKDVDVKKSTGQNGKTFGGYKGISADLVVAIGKNILTQNGILYSGDLAEEPPRKNGNKTEVKIVGTFTNVDDPSDTMTRSSWGEGNDNSAHGYQKATTNAEKIIIGKALMMTTVEDETAIVPTELEPTGVREAKAETEATMRAWADNFKLALEGCTTLTGLAAVRRDNAHMLKSANLPEATREYFQDMIASLEGTLQ